MDAPPVAAPLPAPAKTGSGGACQPAAAAARREVLAHPEALHPALWLGHQLGRHAESAQSAVATGFPLLNVQLPGGGWPRRALTELLLPHAGIGEIRLLAPSLMDSQQAGRLVMLFDPPSALSAVALARIGFDLEELLIINTRARVIPGTDSLWALEQALKSGHVGAVLAWLPPRLRAERLRRLQLAAHAHDGPAFVLRELSAAQRPTSAPLRLGLRSAGADTLAVQVLKRRGPSLEAPILLALPPVLSPQARERAARLAAEARAVVAARRGAGHGPSPIDDSRQSRLRRGGARDEPTGLPSAAFVDRG